MNTKIQTRTNNKLTQNEQLGQHKWFYQSNINNKKHEYIIYANVFSPAIFSGTAWLTDTIVKYFISKNEVFNNKDKDKDQDKDKDENKIVKNILEIGTGCGVTAIQLALLLPDLNYKIYACDINQQAVINAKINAEKLSAKNIQIKRSDRFQAYNGKIFDVIYWNFPFHPSDKKYDNLSILQKAVRDPGYKLLSLFLSQSGKYLNKNGFILMGFSYTMGDYKLMQELACKNQWKLEEIGRIDQNCGGICLIKMEKCYENSH